jgi:hypothetical protein
VSAKVGSGNVVFYVGGASGRADVGVILNPSRPYPMVWDQRRM